MKTTNYTPGTWQISFGNIVDKNKKTICFLPERKTNDTAHLISAAPDLLSALQEAYNAIAWDVPGGNLSDAEEEALLDTIRAAIAKAEGRAE